MNSFILTVRPQPDADMDVACLARRAVAAMASPVMTPAYLIREHRFAGGNRRPDLYQPARHHRFLISSAGRSAAWRRIPVFAVGRASGRAARLAGFCDVTTVPAAVPGLRRLSGAARPDHRAASLACAVQRGFDMAAALAPTWP